MSAGRAFILGDNVDTDALAPGIYMKGKMEALLPHCLEAVRPDFAGSVRPGDVLVAGSGFGIGSSREQAAQALVMLGISAVLARSFGGIFHRNALNLGLPVLVCRDTSRIHEGDRVEVDVASGQVRNETTGEVLETERLPPFLLEMLAAGGLVASLERRFAHRTGQAPGTT